MIGIGAVIGDMFGSKYEFGKKGIVFNPFLYELTHKSGKIQSTDLYHVTDDSILTLAVKNAIMEQYSSYVGKGEISDDEYKKDFSELIIKNFEYFGNEYPKAGYGKKFKMWLKDKDKKPYGSYGNGAAMRVSSVAYISPNLDTTLELAKISAEVTHNSEEGIKGAQAVAAAIWMAKAKASKDEIKDYIEKTFGYDLSIPPEDVYDETKEVKGYELSAQLTVPEALICFMDSESFEDCIVLATELGGDTDTRAAIAGSIAEAYYGVPMYLKRMALNKLETTDLYDLLISDSGFSDSES